MLVSGIAAALSLAANPVVETELPAWMAGCWVEQTDENWTEECWTVPRTGSMLGSARTGNAAELLHWEAMQIFIGSDTETPMQFYASPRGDKRVKFEWQASDMPGLTFVNLDNDYPQRIRYWPEGAYLMAEIAMADGSRSKQWRFSRLGE